MTVGFKHPWVTISDSARDIFITDPESNIITNWAASQFLSCCAHERDLRSAAFSADEMDPIPGGYEELRVLWNAEPTCPFGFSFINEDDEVVTIKKDPIPENFLQPLLAAINPARTDGEIDPELARGALQLVAQQSIRAAEAKKRAITTRLNKRDFAAALGSAKNVASQARRASKSASAGPSKRLRAASTSRGRKTNTKRIDDEESDYNDSDDVMDGKDTK